MKKGQRLLGIILGLMIGASLLTVSVLAAMEAAGTPSVSAGGDAPVLYASGDTTVTPTPKPTPTSSSTTNTNVPGDLNGDRVADAADAVHLMQGAAGKHSVDGDLNGDGAVDILDVIRFVRWLSGDDVTLE